MKTPKGILSTSKIIFLFHISRVFMQNNKIASLTTRKMVIRTLKIFKQLLPVKMSWKYYKNSLFNSVTLQKYSLKLFPRKYFSVQVQHHCLRFMQGNVRDMNINEVFNW